jgi:hypothetical protein
MKLKEYNSLNSKSIRIGEPTLRVDQKKGTITLSKASCDMIELQDNDEILFLQDEDKPKDWYISKTQKPGGIRVRRPNCQYGIFNAHALSVQIMKEIGIMHPFAVFRIAGLPVVENGHTMWAILNGTAATQIIRRTRKSDKVEA